MGRTTGPATTPKPKAVTGAAARRKRIEEKIAAEEAEFSAAQEQLAGARAAVEQLTSAIQVRAGRIAAVREELEAG